ncbi:alpha/beta-hydrolase [Lojkania enalia]|uniref:Alpha/beta-hydrolase n=1 Tax=Lojkania enalia TaxID=147567 RepID=A0A9P4NC37_9PLEO|nr:alpha/beta-hydrolase [Didymosphaeria enalia]
MSSTQNILHHPTLGCNLLGKHFQITIEYRGLKYASIPARWKPSIPINSLSMVGDGLFDATRFGPSCPQKYRAQAWDLTLIGNETLPVEEGQGDTERFDELECLHVNVTVPDVFSKKDGRKEEKLLPVFVWVHGGGLSMGGNSWPQYSLQKFVSRSMEMGKPVIGVSINYRVGILGFLASRELGADGNYGFRDQVNAFRWVKKHIRGFGGDPGNVTAIGESAGAISLSKLMCADIGEGLFERVIIMSGEATLRKPRRWKWHEEMYKDQLKFLGLDQLEKNQRIKKLREMSAEEMCQNLPLAQHFCALVDGDWLKEDVTLGLLADGSVGMHKPDWCNEFIVGDTAHDGTVLKARILDDPNALTRLYNICNSDLTPSETQKILAAYNLTKNSSSEERNRGLLLLASELRFYLPALCVHRGWRSSIPAKCSHKYHFHIPNPVLGPFKGISSHELDVAFLFQNFNHAFDEQSKEVARQMADQWIRSINGEAWAEEGYSVVIREKGVHTVCEQEYDEMFRNGRGKLLEEIGGDRLWKLAEAWQGVRPDEIDVSIKANL